MILHHQHQTIHEEALRVAAKYLRAEADLLDILQKVEEHRVYRHFECTSLYAYAVKILNLSDDTALNFISVARKAKEVPALKQKIREGKFSVSKARKITSVLTPENQCQWIEMAISLPQKKLEREVAKVNPKAAMPHRMKYLSGTRVYLSLNLAEETMQDFKQVQDLLSQKNKRAADFEEVLKEMLGEYLRKHDPVKRAERAWAKEHKPVVARRVKSEALRQVKVEETRGDSKSAQAQQDCSGSDAVSEYSKLSREPIPAKLKHQLVLRDQNQCAYKDSDGVRCGQKRWLELHHIKPVSQGGENVIENLTTLCSSHHKVLHMP